MANIKSQIKRNRQNQTRHERNKAVRSEIRTRLRTVDQAIETGADDLDSKVQAAVKRLDSAASKGVIHKNEAARRKSRLLTRANTAS